MVLFSVGYDQAECHLTEDWRVKVSNPCITRQPWVGTSSRCSFFAENAEPSLSYDTKTTVASKAAAILRTNASVITISSLSFQARELKFCIHTPYIRDEQGGPADADGSCLPWFALPCLSLEKPLKLRPTQNFKNHLGNFFDINMRSLYGHMGDRVEAIVVIESITEETLES